RRFDCFDYSVPKELENKIKTGHLVAVYFRNRKIYGIVAGLMQKTAQKTKPIEALTDIILPKTLLKMADWASNYYLVSPSLLYKLILPAPTKERGEPKCEIPQKMLTLAQAESENVIKNLKNYTGSNLFLYDNNFKETLAVFVKLAQKALENKKQILFLVPSPQDINRIAPYLKKIFNDNLVVWHGKLSAGKKFSGWKKILSGDSCVVLGTRPACFLPFFNLSLTLIYNHTSADLKQWDQNPRYDARKIAEKLQELHGAQIVFSDTIPNLELFNKIKTGEIASLNASGVSHSFSLVDLKKEKNFFSFPLYEMIKQGLEKKQRLVLFVNRQEKDSILICNDCRSVVACPKCEQPFLVDKNEFLCYHCNIKKPAKAICDKCGGASLKPLRLGIESIKKAIEKEFSESKVEAATKTKKSSADWDILLTTDYFWKNILPKIDTNNIYGVAMLDFDFYLIRPEFNQKESALEAIYKFLKFSDNRRALIQTNNPENEIFGEFEKIYEKELQERKEINYPPYSRLIKIICKAKDKRDLDAETNKLYDELRRAGFNPLPPFEPFIKKRTKNYLKHIILKESLDKNLANLRKIIPDEYQIDVDPISIY
ncbi:hypothetical protein KJ885_00880, partial [Patescibacteria group bacterium]|nr:hypothetical protein [Patescibacteria group bacterium]